MWIQAFGFGTFTSQWGKNKAHSPKTKPMPGYKPGLTLKPCWGKKAAPASVSSKYFIVQKYIFFVQCWGMFSSEGLSRH